MIAPASKSNEPHPLDALTGGAFSAPTAGERAARVREWLASGPTPEQMQEVFKDLSARDKGAARPLREKLEELRRSKGQEAIASEWAGRGQALLELPKLNIADAMAWQRDAAKAGAPLSREPLSSLKVKLAERVKAVEDLQNGAQVQREAAVLLAQRIEVLSTKPWREAQAAWNTLRADVEHWEGQARAFGADANWPSVDARFAPMLESSRAQLLVVWDAFQGALSQAVAAADDAAAPLPPVPVWADELRAARGVAVEEAARAQKPKIDPQVRAQATQAVQEVLARLDQELAEGHGKASAGAAAALRAALKEHGRLIDDKLENQAHGSLAAAGELEGWQRWRADQLRAELVSRAEGLLQRAAGQELGGRKMQETLRALREQWKQTDQGGVPNHAMWKRFDDACNEAYKVVEAWLDKIKAEAAQSRAQRLALIEEVKAWSAANQTALDDDWKGFSRILHQFSERWREGGHMSEKAFVELQAQWKDAIHTAAAPLEAVQKQSLERRHAMIAEATALGEAPMLHIDGVRALQQRWQAEALAIPLDRRQEQKLWDAFRKPIDDAFNRKTAEREKAAAAMGEHDRAVLEASRGVDAANASGDAQKIRAAVAALEAALRGQRVAKADASAMPAAAAPEAAPAPEASVPVQSAEDPAREPEAPANAEASGEVAPPTAPARPVKPLVAMRGDDRPGMKKAEPAFAARGGKPGERRDGPRAARPDNRFEPRRDDRRAGPGSRFGERPAAEARGPRLGDTAFRAQRDALERADAALRKLAAQAHGEALTQLLAAWEKRDAGLVPGVQELGGKVNATARGAWVKALQAEASGDVAPVLLRLEIAADVPTPAAQHDQRRMMQLQLLTQRHAPSPAETWTQDVAALLAGAYDAGQGRRAQTVLKALLKR